MWQPIVESLLYVLGFITFGAGMGYVVSALLARSSKDPLLSAQHRDSQPVKKLVRRIAVWTCAIVSGAIGIMAMVHDGPIAVLLHQ